MPYMQPIVPAATHQRIAAYAADLIAGHATPGAYLQEWLRSPSQLTAEHLTPEELLSLLLPTKKPCIFAESAVYGDGSDWTLRELGLLGDVSVLTEVTIYDDGRHQNPVVHPQPFPGTLIFTPGALLRNDTGHTPADWDEVVTPAGELNPAAYRALYARRLVPVFDEIQRRAARRSRRAVVTVPGLGCGQFAGRFRGQLGPAFRDALVQILSAHADAWPSIALVYFDPYNECVPSAERFHALDFRVRPLNRMPGGGLPQLCHPTAYQENGDNFADCDLYSLVAWDHVSWPGNDFNGGRRATDDGVKAAATSALGVITAKTGAYDPEQNAYLPPLGYQTWADLIEDNFIIFWPSRPDFE